MQHVIIGAGPAGVVAAETLRKHDPDAQITLLSSEAEPPYSRMAIPYLLVDQIDEAGTHLRKDAAHFERQRIDVRTGTRVTGIDPGRHRLQLAGAGELVYDRLLIATGSRPIVPPIPGVELPGVHTCWTLDDARALISRATPGASVVLIGAGFIGCIILEALVGRGARLTVVEQQDRMVPRMMDARAGGLIKTWCQGKGVDVRTDTRVEAVEAGTPLSVRLDDGSRVAADLVIVCVGVVANTGLVAGAGIACDQGLLVNRHLQTSVADIYAAGDVAQGVDFSTGAQAVHAVQPTAADHGRIAALNMCGRSIAYQGSVNMNVLDTLGLISSSFGLWMGAEGGDSAHVYAPAVFRYVNLQFEGDRLVGGSAIGLTSHVGVLRGLIQSRVRLGGWKAKLMRDPTRVMEAYLACTQPIGHNGRLARAS